MKSKIVTLGSTNMELNLANSSVEIELVLFLETDESLFTTNATDEDEWCLAFSYALEREMERANMSVNQLAKLLNKSPGTVTRYLKGTSEPTGFIIYRMSEIFNCDFSDLEYMDFYL